jgi:hypothetical protein
MTSSNGRGGSGWVLNRVDMPANVPMPGTRVDINESGDAGEAKCAGDVTVGEASAGGRRCEAAVGETATGETAAGGTVGADSAATYVGGGSRFISSTSLIKPSRGSDGIGLDGWGVDPSGMARLGCDGRPWLCARPVVTSTGRGEVVDARC